MNVEISNCLLLGGGLLTCGSLYLRNYPMVVLSSYYLGVETLLRFQLDLSGYCAHLSNQYSSLLALGLLAFQPALWNWFRYHKNYQNKKVFEFASYASLIWGIGYLMRLIPTSSQIIYHNELMTGNHFCLYKGINSILWKFPLYNWRGLEPNFFPYLLLWFLPSLWEDRYKITKLGVWMGQFGLTIYLSNTYDEVPSMWSLISIPFIISMSITRFYF